jgi:hypothetical protein
MVVAVGPTLWVPPVTGREKLLESRLSVMTTLFEFVATTVSVLDCPATTEVGFALIVIVGFPTGVTVTVACAVAVPVPVPVTVMV